MTTATWPAMFASRSWHPGGVQVSMCGASGRFISDTIDVSTWRYVSTAKGKEPLGQL